MPRAPLALSWDHPVKMGLVIFTRPFSGPQKVSSSRGELDEAVAAVQTNHGGHMYPLSPTPCEGGLAQQQTHLAEVGWRFRAMR